MVDTAVRREPENVYITFRITEGAPMVVGQPRDHRPRLAARLAPAHRDCSTSRSRKATPSTATSCRQSADSIERRLRDRGYPSATVFTGFEADRAALVARVNLEVDPSSRAVIGDVDVVGVRRIDTALVRDLLVSRPGRRYSQDELLLSQQNLYKSDLFRYATVNIDSAELPAGGRHGAAAGRR